MLWLLCVLALLHLRWDYSCELEIFARVRANWCKGGGVLLGPGADHAQMFCGAVGVLRCARTAPAAPPRRGMLVSHVVGCCCDPDFWWGDCFHRPECRELESIVCCSMMIGAVGWIGGWTLVRQDLPARCGASNGGACVIPCQSPDFRVFGEGGCLHRPGCRALGSVAVSAEMIGAIGWLLVCRDLPARCGAR